MTYVVLCFESTRSFVQCVRLNVRLRYLSGEQNIFVQVPRISVVNAIERQLYIVYFQSYQVTYYADFLLQWTFDEFTRDGKIPLILVTCWIFVILGLFVNNKNTDQYYGSSRLIPLVKSKPRRWEIAFFLFLLLGASIMCQVISKKRVFINKRANFKHAATSTSSRHTRHFEKINHKCYIIRLSKLCDNNGEDNKPILKMLILRHRMTRYRVYHLSDTSTTT